MDVVYPRCCGLDVHKKSVVACLITPGPDGTPQRAICSFGTMTAELLALADWLLAAGCTHVAMESTGVYWKPLYNLLEGSFTLLLVNPQHIKAVPGRKTDVKDAEWLADLLRHGLLRASFIPDRPQRELRELTRYRTALIRERAAEVNRLQKVLEGANIKLASVASDVLGVSGRAMVEALVEGTQEAEAMADLAQGRMRSKRAELARALEGRVGEHQRFLLPQMLTHLDFMDQAIAQVSARVAELMRPFEAELTRLDTIPGVGRATAEILVAELGVDLSRFPSARHLAAWAGLAPGNHESAGKRRPTAVRKGNRALREALIEAANAVGRSNKTYVAAQYHRLARRRGKKKAAVAVAHTILVIAYQLLTRGTDYHDLGANYFDERDRQHLERHLVHRLEALGYEVSLKPVAA